MNYGNILLYFSPVFNLLCTLVQFFILRARFLANIKARKRNQIILRFLNGVGATTSLFVGSVIQLDLTSSQINQYPIWKLSVESIKNNAPFLLSICALLIIVTYVFLKLTNSASILKCLQAKLDALRDWLCCNIDGDLDDNHRVTLFQHKSTYFGLILRPRYWAVKYFPWSWNKNPWSGWLVPVARSGYTGQKARSVFWAPDSGRKAEGVAGIAWAKGGDMVYFEKLPAINVLSSEANKLRYCNQTKIKLDWLERYIKEGNSPARSFLAFSLLVDAEPWGVVVVDSQSAEGINVNEIERALYNACCLVPILLEEL